VTPKITDLSRKLLKSFLHFPGALALVWEASRGWTIAWVCLLIVQGLLPVATVYLTKSLIDSLVLALDDTGDVTRLRAVATWAILIGGVLLLSGVLRSIATLIRHHQSELLKDHISRLIYRQSVTVDYAFYEMADYYDKLHRAREDAGYRTIDLIESLGGLLQDGITLIGMITVITLFKWWLPVALLLSTLPALVVVLRHTMKHYEWRLKSTADRRLTWYYDWILTTDMAAAEIRLFNLGEHFQTAYQKLRDHLRRERLRLAKGQSIGELLARVWALLIMGGVMALMLREAVLGTVTLGTLALFYQAFNQGQGIMQSLLGNVGQLYSNSLFLGDLFDFLALKPGVADPDTPVVAPPALNKGIEFESVTFKYPESERVALRDFSLLIPAKKTTAIVGLNGAGKTTLIKLLCRLYDPTEGRIKIDGVDIREMRVDDLRRMITVLFQQPVHYNTAVSENIRLGDIAVSDNRERMIEASRAAGAQEIIAKLPSGYESLLGKWFVDGTELSVGEWQRIALARAFWRDAQIVLLDEPTSAMDSWAEAEWMKNFRGLTEDRTVLVITHRFTTAMRADLIHVMSEGKIIESGTHQTLISLGGNYAWSWAEQIKFSNK
jgi:ATP-binding cassette subfamily B protein